MHGEGGVSRAARHQQLARIQEAARKADEIVKETAAIGAAADRVGSQARALRAEVDDAIANIRESLRHAHEGERGEDVP